MSALTERQRKYVLAMACNPFGTPSDWAEAAGYSQHGAGSRVAGHYNKHNPRIEAAVSEVAQSLLYTEGPMLAAAGLLQIARNPNHPKHLRALETLANRVGLHETSEHTVKVQHTDVTGTALMGRIKALAEKLGMDQTKLIGGNAVAAPVIEAEFKEVENAEPRPE